MRVLIVDDDHIICRCLQTEIDWEKIGCELPIIAYNGVDAMTIMETECPDIVISDVRMPMMDGTALCRLIHEKYPNVAVLIISAYEDFKVAQLALRYHVKGYILKPLNRNSLLMLEEMIENEVRLKGEQEFLRTIVANGYQTYLETIIEKNDIPALEEFLDRLSEMKDNSQMRQMSIWQNLLIPITEYNYKKRSADSRILYEEERQRKEILKALKVEERIAYIRECYLQFMHGTQNDDLYSEMIMQIQKIISEEYGSPDMNVTYLGRKFYMSPAYLGQLFLEHTGIKLVEYIAEKRLENACQLLRGTNKPVKEIAEASGWPDPNYFSRMFRKKIGMAPGEYRQKFQKLDSKALWKELKNHEEMDS